MTTAMRVVGHTSKKPNKPQKGANGKKRKKEPEVDRSKYGFTPIKARVFSPKGAYG
jgi:hypothetical protein